MGAQFTSYKNEQRCLYLRVILEEAGQGKSERKGMCFV